MMADTATLAACWDPPGSFGCHETASAATVSTPDCLSSFARFSSSGALLPAAMAADSHPESRPQSPALLQTHVMARQVAADRQLSCLLLRCGSDECSDLADHAVTGHIPGVVQYIQHSRSLKKWRNMGADGSAPLSARLGLNNRERDADASSGDRGFRLDDCTPAHLVSWQVDGLQLCCWTPHAAGSTCHAQHRLCSRTSLALANLPSSF